MKRRQSSVAAGLTALVFALVLFAPVARAAEPFGFSAFSFEAENQNGTPATEAGTHPYQLAIDLELNEGPESPGQPGVPFPAGDLRDLRLSLPSGLIGNPSAISHCSSALFNAPRSSPFEVSRSGESCPDKSQVGVITVHTSLGGGTSRSFGLFNLTPPPGFAAMLGASPFGQPIAFGGRVRNEAGEYGLDLEARNFPQGLAIDAVEIAIWGTPWAAAHDGERGNCLNEAEPLAPWSTCSVGPEKTNRPLAFLTLPTSCSAPLVLTASADSWQAPGAFVDVSATQPALLRCDRLSFATSSFSGPTTSRVSSATGFDFNLSVKQEGLLEPGGLAGSEVQKAQVALPEGFTINPSVGAGLGVCTPGDYAAETATSVPGAGCPNSSKIGTFTLQSPLLVEETTSFEQLIEGSIYLAQPGQNPFGALVGIYLVARAPNGILVKVAGRLQPDPSSGRITALFEGLPQLPYSNLKIHFREGQRAPLATAAGCGHYVTQVELTPWQSSSQIVPSVLHQNFEFQLTQGIGGGPCPAVTPPFAPGAEIGSVNSNAGSYSPFYLHLTRGDGEDEITSYSALLPSGLTGRLTGIPYCPEAAIAAARTMSGVAETAAPSCPAASEIGHTVVGYGLGGVLTYAPGRLYLAGPYRGAPLSILAVDPALVGPFDLGTILVRSAIFVDPLTAQVRIDSAASDPIPHILGGIPLHLRDIRVYISRPNFTLNPTSCEPATAISTLTGSAPPFANPAAASASPASPFHLNNCSSLGFAPRIALKLLGQTRPNGFPALRATVLERPGDANLKSAAVTLPRAEFLAQEHLRGVCTQSQFAAGAGNGSQCPANSVYGHARAFSPLLPQPLEGPVFLRSGSHRLPDLVVAMSGDGGLAIDLVGRVDSVRGGMRASFEGLPDAPASKFVLTLSGGKRGLLVNSADVCQAPATASVRMAGQNNAGYAPQVQLQNECAAKKKGKGKKPKKGKKAKHGRAGGGSR